MSGQIFISYRREESRWSARSLRDRLCRGFDPEQIFMDLDAIALGEDFVEAIERTVATCDVLIALIGNNWLAAKDERGNRRLDNPEDFVRREIATALKRGILVIPVLVDGALMPSSTDLPGDLKLLVRRNALRITDTSFDGDCQRLTAAIKLVLEKAADKKRRKEEQEEPKAEKRPEEQERSEVRKRQFDATEYFELGQYCFEVGQYDKAISDYTKAIQLKPDFALAYYNRALAYQKLGHFGKADQDRRKAQELEAKK